MQAGREIDALVAEKVMGLKVNAPGTVGGRMDEANGVAAPHYSTDIAAAAELIPLINDHFPQFCLQRWESDDGTEQDGGSWFFYAREHTDGTADAQAYTLPHLLCLAALAAVGHSPD